MAQKDQFESGEITPETEPVKHKRTMSRFGKIMAGALGGLFVFMLGINIGNGSITLGGPNSRNGDLPSQLDYTSVNEMYSALRASYDGKLDTNKLLEGLKDGLAEASGDPYTEFFTTEQAKEFEDQLNNSFTGIGAELGRDSDKNLIIVAPIDDTPAYKAGLKPQDIIAEINGQNTFGLSIEEAVGKIRGEKGTKVTLKIIRNKTKTLTVTIIRADIKVPGVRTKILPGNIGYMEVNTFSENTASLAEQAAQKFRDQKVKGVVLDVRGNPGGLVDAAIDVSSLWLPKGKLIMQEKRDGVVTQSYTATGNDILAGIPTVVLIDPGSASASEIVAGALKDSGVATIIGEKSYGKGSVQELKSLRDGGKLKVTIARWYRPNGQNIDKKGITPDKTVKLTDKDSEVGKDPQLQAAQLQLDK